MPDLELPDLLGGPWQHALFLSYGLDLPFFERALAAQLPSSCRNRILLGDERTYLAACEHYADSGLVRHANRRYVAEPILRRSPSHAKVILLTAPDAGRLLVGSGNISLQGFGSGGELFKLYEHGGAERSQLAEFVALRELLERLRDDALLTRGAAWHLDQLLESTPWLFQGAGDARAGLRHNLDQSFSDQLVAEVGGAPVEELRVLAPFFDPGAAALRSLIKRLRPRRTVLLLQKGRTELDPDVLRGLLDRVEARPIERVADRDAYVHAKLFLIRLADEDICLQGSPNASVAALEREHPAGNFEVANLLRGPRGTFDAIFEGLRIGEPVLDVDALDLKPPEVDDPDPLSDHGWQLTAAEWSNGLLRLLHRGALPALDGLMVLVGAARHVAAITAQEPGRLDLAVTLESGERVTAGTPIRLVFADDTSSNPVFPCDRMALEAMLHTAGAGDEALIRIGDLDLGDDELEQLLHELESALVVDQRSLWQLAGRHEPPPESSESELALAYEDVDYDLLRTHPKLRQYFGARGGHGHGRSRLQIILNSITQAFANLLESADEAALEAAAAALAAAGESPSATPEDAEDEEAPRARWSAQARINMLLRNFVQRFLKGLGSPAFQDIVGVEVVTQNYVVFLHFLAKLAEREWIDDDFMLDATARTIDLFWGGEGYVPRLVDQDRDTATRLLRELHSDAQLLATLYAYAVETRVEHDEDGRRRVRDAWTDMLDGGVFPVTPAALADARSLLRGFAPPDGPTPLALVEELMELAAFSTRGELLARVRERLGRCWFTREKVKRAGEPTVVECLTIEDDSVALSVPDARWILSEWMSVESLEHYRVALRRSDAVRPHTVAFYEPSGRRGKFAVVMPPTPPVELTALRQPPSPWDDALLALLEATDELSGEVASDGLS